MPRVECPKCTAQLEVDADTISRFTECPHCDEVFRAFERSYREPEEAPPLNGYYTDSYDPTDYAERKAVVAEAQRRVLVPGQGLLITGMIGIAATTIIGLLLAINSIDGRHGANSKDLIHGAGYFIAIDFYCFLVAAGGYQLRSLNNRGFSLFAAFLAVFSAAFCGAWIIISIPAVFFGTWAFVALNSREVKHAMRWKRQEREDRRVV